MYKSKDCVFQIGTSVANPYCKSVHQSTMAPWMGKHTRLRDILPKTEIKKALKEKNDQNKHSPEQIIEDIILQTTDSEKVKLIKFLFVVFF